MGGFPHYNGFLFTPATYRNWAKHIILEKVLLSLPKIFPTMKNTIFCFTLLTCAMRIVLHRHIANKSLGRGKIEENSQPRKAELKI